MDSSRSDLRTGTPVCHLRQGNELDASGFSSHSFGRARFSLGGSPLLGSSLPVGAK